jgi:hypothetical protein
MAFSSIQNISSFINNKIVYNKGINSVVAKFTNKLSSNAPDQSWTGLATSVNGDRIYSIYYNNGLYLSNDYGSTFSYNFINGVSALFTSVCCADNSGALAMVTTDRKVYATLNSSNVNNWYEVSYDGIPPPYGSGPNSSSSWTCSCMDSTGQYGAVAANNGYVWINVDGISANPVNPSIINLFASSWTSTSQTQGISANWTSLVFCGTNLLASTINQGIYICTNYGQGVWTQANNGLPENYNSINWVYLASTCKNTNVSGNYYAFLLGNNKIYRTQISPNSTVVLWKKISIGLPVVNWRSITSNDIGKFITVCGPNNGPNNIYTSFNYGLTWFSQDILLDNKNYSACSYYNNGQNIALAINGINIITANTYSVNNPAVWFKFLPTDVSGLSITNYGYVNNYGDTTTYNGSIFYELSAADYVPDLLTVSITNNPSTGAINFTKNDYLILGNSVNFFSIPSSGAVTFSLWYNFLAYQNKKYNHIIDINTSATDISGSQFLLSTNTVNNGLTIENLARTTSPKINITGNVRKSNWYHAVLIIRSTNVCTVYINNISVVTNAALLYPNIYSFANACIGRQAENGTGDNFTGNIADVRVYNYALNYSEVNYLYNNPI